MEVELVPAEKQDKSVVRNLMELYLYDFSEFAGDDVDEHGLYGYNRLDHYWTEPGRYPFLFRVDGAWAGFALVSSFSYFGVTRQDVYAFAEFFVMRKYRRRGVGSRMARALFKRFPGRWEIAEMPENIAAQAFWRRVIGEFTSGRYEEHVLANDQWHGPVQVFDSPG